MSEVFASLDKPLEHETKVLGRTLDRMIDNPALSIDDLLAQLSSEDSRDVVESAALQFDPYEQIHLGDGKDPTDMKKWYVLSLTNLRNIYMHKFFITGFIGFLNEASGQWITKEGTSSASDKTDDFCPEGYYLPTDEARQHVKDFLNAVFAFDPNRHCKIAMDVIKKDDVERRIGEIVDIPKNLVEQIPSLNLFVNVSRYFERFYEGIRSVTKLLYNDVAHLEDAINVLGDFNSEEEAKEFCKVNSDKFTIPPVAVTNRVWTLYAPFNKNKDNTELYSKDCDIMKSILQKQHEDKILMDDFQKNRATKASKKTINDLSEEDKEKLNTYKKFIDSCNVKGTHEITKEDLEKMEQHKKWMSDTLGEIMLPDDGIMVPIMEIDGNKMNRKILYTKAESPAETANRLEKENPELYKLMVKKEDSKSYDTAITPSGKKIQSKKR